MPLEDSDNQVNGDICMKDDSMKSEKEFLQFNPRPQRVLKLNRRGFYMSCRSKEDKPSTDANSQKSDLPKKSSNCGKVNISIQETTPSSEKKIIKLNSSKKYSLSGSENTVKSTLNGDQSVSSPNICQEKCDQELPPKKKHKPITWP